MLVVIDANKKTFFFADGKLDSELEEMLSDDSETDEDEEDYRYERKEKKKPKNVFVDEEAEDSDQNQSEDEEDDTVKVQSALDRSPDQSDEEDNRDSLTEYKGRIKKHELDDSTSASRSDIKLNLKVNFLTLYFG